MNKPYLEWYADKDGDHFDELWIVFRIPESAWLYITHEHVMRPLYNMFVGHVMGASTWGMYITPYFGGFIPEYWRIYAMRPDLRGFPLQLTEGEVVEVTYESRGLDWRGAVQTTLHLSPSSPLS